MKYFREMFINKQVSRDFYINGSEPASSGLTQSLNHTAATQTFDQLRVTNEPSMLVFRVLEEAPFSLFSLLFYSNYR